MPEKEDDDKFAQNPTLCSLLEAALRDQKAVNELVQVAGRHEDALKRAIEALNRHSAESPALISGQVKTMLVASLTEEVREKFASLNEQAEELRATYARAATKASRSFVRLPLLCVVCTVVTFVLMVKLIMPDAQELQRLRFEKAQLEQTISLLEQKGGRADIRQCAVSGASQKSRLCIRIDDEQTPYGSEKTGVYHVIYGY